MAYEELKEHAKLSKAKNNARFSYDNESESDRVKETLRRALSRGYDPDTVKYIQVIEQIFSDIALISLYDVHDGAIGVNELRFRLAIEYIRRLSNAYVVFGGDTLNNTTLSSLGAKPNADKYNADDGVDKLAMQLLCIVHKIITVLDGNHDGLKAGRTSNDPVSFVKNLANKLGLHYTPYGVLVDIKLPSKDANRKPDSLKVFCFHASDKCPGMASAPDITFQKAMDDLANSGIVPDVIIGGHFHANTNGIYKFKTFEIDPDTHVKKVVYVDIPVISESSLQETAEYAAAHDAAQTDSNVYINVLAKKAGSLLKERIPMFINDKKSDREIYEYVMDHADYFDEHPEQLFDKCLKLFTPRALEYMETHKEPIKEVQKEVAKVKASDDKTKMAYVHSSLYGVNEKPEEDVMTMNKEGK